MEIAFWLIHGLFGSIFTMEYAYRKEDSLPVPFEALAPYIAASAVLGPVILFMIIIVAFANYLLSLIGDDYVGKK